MHMVRCFAAIDLPGAERGRLAALLKEVSSIGLDAKQVEEHNLHVTLVFLGEVPEEALAGKAEALKSLSFAPFELELRGLGFFPSRQRVSTFWAGCGTGSAQVAELHARVSQLLGAAEEKRFVPHVALARVKSSRNLDSLRALADRYSDESWGRFTVESVKLKKSTLTSSGPVYEDLSVAGLRA